MTPRPADVTDCFGARVEENARQHGNHSAIVCEGKTVNWSQFNALANQYADAMRDQGLVRNDRVCVMMENRIEFLALAGWIEQARRYRRLAEHEFNRPFAHALH
jgi:long-subunit acyl-CoA synthetase (AMP-forming)